MDYLTGEVTESIGEIVFDGSQDGEYYHTYDESLGILTIRLPKITNIKNDGVNLYGLLSDKYVSVTNQSPNNIMAYNTRIMITKPISELESFSTSDKIKSFLSQNPITLQYPLQTSITKTVDLTIKDLDDKIVKTLHTHPSTTQINLSSDGLIPSAELSYTMYGNIGETTGEQITDGTDSKLIEGKEYGDTLLNVLPSPSLKNSMDYNTSMQKLNDGYDNINVVDGEFKSAILKGDSQRVFSPTKN